MNTSDKYYDLCYTKRIHEFYKIDQYKNWPAGEARKKYKSLDEFYLAELQVSKEMLARLRAEFDDFNALYCRYYNQQRQDLFSSPAQLLQWYKDQKGSCNYCGVTQSDLLKIVDNRNGNLTLNEKTKRSKGTLEIEKLNPAEGYTFKNSVLACPFCNNAKSNLISEEDWRKFFVPAIKHYFTKLLSE